MIDTWRDGWTDRKTVGQINKWIYIGTDSGRMDRQMDKWTDG